MTASEPRFARTVAQHRAHILAATAELPTVSVSITHALGRTTAAPVLATLEIPAFDNSAMDGYAVRVGDVDAARVVVADIPAGAPPGAAIAPGEAARIMTGAPLPLGADAIVPHEQTAEPFRSVVPGGTVHLHQVPVAGSHIRRRGEDAAIGDVIVGAGERLGPLQQSAAAAAGAASVLVRPAPRVVVIATGDELVPAGERVGAGQIPESNGVLLEGAVTDADATVVRREIVGDDPARLRAVLAELAAEAPDAVILTGGASVGAYEVVREVLEPTGVEFLTVAMQPGKPQGYGLIGAGIPVFCLPGNPVSVAVSFEAFVRPALLRMQGRRQLERPLQRLRVTRGWRTPPGREQYMPVAVDRGDPRAWTVHPATPGGSGSHRAGALALAEGWAIVPAAVGEVRVGDEVDVMLVS